MILLISDVADIQLYWVTHFLKEKNAGFLIFDPGRFPISVSQHSYISDEAIVDDWVTDDGVLFQSSDVTSVWYRKPSLPRIANNLRPEEREYTLNECRQALYGLYNRLLDRFWISNIHNIRISGNKPLQLAEARRIGFSIPETVITNCPQRIRKFCSERNGVIYKSLSDGVFIDRDGIWQEPEIKKEIYTTEVTEEMLNGIEFDAKSPCLMQSSIAKEVEIRCTVVLDNAWSISIDAQKTDTGATDWRRADKGQVIYEKYSLPDEVEQKCIKLVRNLGLSYGAIDLIFDKDGRYVFLEVNPNGQYGWLEDTLGPVISSKIADVLMEPPAPVRASGW